MKEKKEYLDYSDVFIIPQYSSVKTRKEVDTSFTFGTKETGFYDIAIPAISSPMDTITESKMAIAMFKGGGFGALHRFMSIQENIQQYRNVKLANAECFVSVGVQEEAKERFKALYSAGARWFIIDIAHGHSSNMRNMLSWVRDTYGDGVFIVAGSVATADAIVALEDWGANVIRCGIGNGGNCITKNVTGVTVPIFSSLQECCDIAKVPIIADGGFRELGDVCKAVAIGASFIMSGRFFAGCDECPETAFSKDGKAHYRGMASTSAMLKIKEGTLPVPEGIESTLEKKGPVVKVLNEIQGALQSSMSYTNATSIKEFQSKVRFGVRRK